MHAAAYRIDTTGANGLYTCPTINNFVGDGIAMGMDLGGTPSVRFGAVLMSEANARELIWEYLEPLPLFMYVGTSHIGTEFLQETFPVQLENREFADETFVRFRACASARALPRVRFRACASARAARSSPSASASPPGAE